MKKLVFVIFALVAFVARADNVITSKEYVDTQVGNLQEQLPAKNTDTVLTYTDTAGTVGEKAIYDASNDYASQQDALVTAGAFNTAVQNALDSEFVCIERQAGTGGCLLYQIRSATRNDRLLPSGYTPVEYLQGNHSGTINTGVIFDSGTLKYSLEVQTGSLVDDYVSTSPNHESDVIGNFTGENISSGFVAGVWCPTKFCSSGTSGIFNYVTPVSLRATSKANNQWHTVITEFADDVMTFTVDGDTLSDTRTAYWNSAPIVLMGGSTTYLPATDRVKIRNIKIWQNDVLVRNYITCRNSNNVYGVYDLVNNTFTATTRGTALTGGPDMSSYNIYLPSGN